MPYSIKINLKKVGKTTRPLRYDLNQIPYDYTVEVTKRFKGLDLIDKVPEELWTEVHDTVQEAVIKTIPHKNKCKKEIWLSEEALVFPVVMYGCESWTIKKAECQRTNAFELCV